MLIWGSGSHTIEPILDSRLVHFSFKVFRGSNLDEDQYCTVFSIADFGAQPNIVERFDKFYESCFGGWLLWTMSDKKYIRR
jgi:hypothetical protein